MFKKMKKAFSFVLACFLSISATFVTNVFAEFKGQVEIKEPTPLLDENGYLTQSGYCFSPLYQYDRSKIKTPSWRTKEWDFYQISNDKFMVQVTIADISLGGAVTVGFQDFTTGKNYSTMDLKFFTGGKYDVGYTDKGLCQNDMTDHSYSLKKKNFDFSLDVKDDKRYIKFDGKASGMDFKVDITLDMLSDKETGKTHESHYIAVPFDTKDGKHFYYNQKTNCMAANGTVTLGENIYEYKGLEDDSFCVLDWGRGVWPLHEVWWWGNGSTQLEDGRIFGFEIGWGFGDTTCASESTLFLDGKAYKIGYLKLEKQDEIVGSFAHVLFGKWKFKDTDRWVIKCYEDPECTIESDDWNLTMTPDYDNYTMLRFLVVGNLCHQVFGRWNGTVKINGETIEINDMYAFLERSDNIW